MCLYVWICTCVLAYVRGCRRASGEPFNECKVGQGRTYIVHRVYAQREGDYYWLADCRISAGVSLWSVGTWEESLSWCRWIRFFCFNLFYFFKRTSKVFERLLFKKF